MSAAQTPLLGDANADLDGHQAASDSSTRLSVPQTPNPLLTNTLRDERGASADRAGGSTPLRTPLRDNLGLNLEDRSRAGSETPRDLKRARNLAQSNLRHALSSLPAPKNDFDIVVDDDDDEPEASTSGHQESDASTRQEDAAERDARLAREAAEEEARAEARRSQVVRRNPTSTGRGGPGAADRAGRGEILGTGGKHPEPESVELQAVSDDSLSAARELMRAELAGQLGFPGANDEVLRRLIAASLDDDDETTATLEAALKRGWAASRTDKARLEQDLSHARSRMAAAAQQASKAKRCWAKCWEATRRGARH
ncbi:hypothetical protein L1887_62967 [Cichorium endivia]|nr:hypothetical protein L1887_62967 [Cichorium endivia]